MLNRTLIALISLTSLLGTSASRAQSPPDKPNAGTLPSRSTAASTLPVTAWRYASQLGQKFTYEFDISVRGADETTYFKGLTHYSVDELTDQQLRLTYRGGLSESTKVHESRKSEGIHFGPRVLPHPHPMSFFGRTDMLGKSQTTNRITLSRQGHILVLDGSSHLPYLLGNVSLIPFEALPAEETHEWSSDSGVTIAMNSEQSRFPYRPMWTLGISNQESVQAASEVIRYQREESVGKLKVIRKTYQMTTPDTGDRQTYHLTGEGKWKFDSQQQVPHSSEMKYTLVVKDRNTTTTFPIELKFSLLTPERIAQLEVEQKEAQEKLAKAAAEHKAQVEKRQAEAEKPLSEHEKKEALAALASGDHFKVHSTLMQLMQRQPKEPDPDIAAMARKFLNDDRGLGMLAERLLLQHDPRFRINHEYTRPMPVPSTGLTVGATTQLFIGQIIQVHEHGRWVAAEVADFLASGDVAIIYRGWGSNRRGTFRRADIQLAPPEVDQPRRTAGNESPTVATGVATPAAMASENVPRASTAAMVATTIMSRSWSDVSGSFRVEALYLGKQGENVLLRRADGKEVAVPLSRLSADDQRYVASLLEEAQRLGNPFEPSATP